MAIADFRGLWPRRLRWGGGDATDCAGVGFGAIRAGGFLPGAYFRGGACAQYNPKVILGAKTRKVMHIVAPRSHNM